MLLRHLRVVVRLREPAASTSRRCRRLDAARDAALDRVDPSASARSITVITRADLRGRIRRAHRSQARLHRRCRPSRGWASSAWRSRAHAAGDAGRPRAPGADGRACPPSPSSWWGGRDGDVRRQVSVHPVGHDAGAGAGSPAVGARGGGAPRLPAFLHPGRRDAVGPAQPWWLGRAARQAARRRGARGDRRNRRASWSTACLRGAHRLDPDLLPRRDPPSRSSRRSGVSGDSTRSRSAGSSS